MPLLNQSQNPQTSLTWVPFRSQKKKKGKQFIEEILSSELEPVSQPVEEFEEPKLDDPLAEPSRIDYRENLRHEAPLLPESVGYPTSIPLLTAETSRDHD